jgi:predicted nucleic acid-binding Zn ribbon protein
MADEPLKVCPNCSQTTLRKVVYPAGVVFKGSGFYTTDYKASGNRSSGNGSASSSEGGSSEKKSDSKPEAKSESKADSGD